MSTMGVEGNALRTGSADWARLSELMTSTSGSVGEASTAGLAPSVQGAAAAFLSAWSGYAGESAAIATGFSGALDAASDDFTNRDDEADQRFSQLDSRLGPAR